MYVKGNVICVASSYSIHSFLMKLRTSISILHIIHENVFTPSWSLSILSDGACINWLSLRTGGWAVNQEKRALHLLDVVESNQADVGLWESLGAVLDLSNNLSSVSASEHWQLPHGPVSVVEVVASDGSSHASSVDGLNVSLLWGRELQAWGESIADNVVNLLDDLVIRERWEERESLEELVVNWVPHLQRVK